MEGQESTSVDVFDVEKIRELVTLMEEHNLSEVDLQQAGQTIRLCRGGQAPAVAAAPVAAAPAPAPAAAPAAAPADNPNIVTINSPMVGTYYSKPNPNSEPFVKVGDRVNTETVICIVEAMKMFNEIQAEISGEIVAILVDNEEPVDHGKPLFKVDTSR